MTKQMRQSTLETLGLGTVLEIFKNGKLPLNTSDLVDKVFGKPNNRGAMVISGASGIVGAGKAMQFASRLLPYNIPIIALDMPGAPDGIGKQYPGLIKAFGKEGADNIMKNIIRLTYDGKNLPDALASYKPKFLLEAIPEILELKKAHYDLFRKKFPGITIYSVTSGFPSSQLGVNIAHPAFPHEINKIFEIVAHPQPFPKGREKNTQGLPHGEDLGDTLSLSKGEAMQLLWSLGLIPVKVSDDWSFVLDVFFCGLMLAGLRYNEQTNTPFWKTDKYIRQLVGPNPFRAHDAIGAKGANFLTWSCLHHLSKTYGELFTPTPSLDERKDSGQNWYPLDHFRPMVNWTKDKNDEDMLRTMILGPLFQMTSIMLKEKRSHLSTMNAIAELCAQFTKGLLATARSMGEEEVINIVKKYHGIHPASAKTKWYSEEFKRMNAPEWQQLYVNAECDGKTGVITIARESYNSDVNAELNRAIDWLKKNKINRVIVTGDFHLSTQMVGADTTEFFPAITHTEEGERIASTWSATARRFYNEFEISIGFVNGKRCMGGMLELMMHCHYLFADENTVFSMPEVTLPVVPGMEGCHWAIRKAKKEDRKNLLNMLLQGKPMKAKETVGWLCDFAGNSEDSIKLAWKIMQKGTSVLPMRKVDANPLGKLPVDEKLIAGANGMQEAMRAIANCAEAACNATLDKALSIQAKHSADFMVTKLCRKGRVGSEYDKIMQ